MKIPVFVSGPTELSKTQEAARTVIIGELDALGMEARALEGKLKPETKDQADIKDQLSFPTPWNNLEAGILFALGRPLLVFREGNVSGGVFDSGVTDVFIHKMPMGKLTTENKNALREVFLNWQRKVRSHYYGD